jgi:hypothetical protein
LLWPKSPEYPVLLAGAKAKDRQIELAQVFWRPQQKKKGNINSRSAFLSHRHFLLHDLLGIKPFYARKLSFLTYLCLGKPLNRHPINCATPLPKSTTSNPSTVASSVNAAHDPRLSFRAARLREETTRNQRVPNL